MERTTNLSVESVSYPDDELSYREDDGKHDDCSAPMMKALDSTRSQESVLVQVGQPFDEPVVLDEKKTDVASSPHIVMLMSTFGRSQLSHQERAVMMFQNVGIPYETIDGSNANRKEERNALFQLSGMRGVYPQFFLVHGEEIAVIGDYDSLESINEASSLPDKLLKENQQILTWDRLMGQTRSERSRRC